MQALVYNLNLKLQKAFIEADIKYVDLLLHGGTGTVLGHDFSIIGLDGTQRLLETCRARLRRRRSPTSSTTRGSRSR